MTYIYINTNGTCKYEMIVLDATENNVEHINTQHIFRNSPVHVKQKDKKAILLLLLFQS